MVRELADLEPGVVNVSIFLPASCCQHLVTTISIIEKGQYSPCHHNVDYRHDYVLALMLTTVPRGDDR